jgi:hypothetical protein
MSKKIQVEVERKNKFICAEQKSAMSASASLLYMRKKANSWIIVCGSSKVESYRDTASAREFNALNLILAASICAGVSQRLFGSAFACVFGENRTRACSTGNTTHTHESRAARLNLRIKENHFCVCSYCTQST